MTTYEENGNPEFRTKFPVRIYKGLDISVPELPGDRLVVVQGKNTKNQKGFETRCVSVPGSHWLSAFFDRSSDQFLPLLQEKWQELENSLVCEYVSENIRTHGKCLDVPKEVLSKEAVFLAFQKSQLKMKRGTLSEKDIREWFQNSAAPIVELVLGMKLAVSAGISENDYNGCEQLPESERNKLFQAVRGYQAAFCKLAEKEPSLRKDQALLMKSTVFENMESIEEDYVAQRLLKRVEGIINPQKKAGEEIELMAI